MSFHLWYSNSLSIPITLIIVYFVTYELSLIIKQFIIFNLKPDKHNISFCQASGRHSIWLMQSPLEGPTGMQGRKISL